MTVEHDDELTREELLERLRVAEDTLDAVRRGETDSVVVVGAAGPQVFTREGANAFYRVLVEQMPAGAAIVRPDGTIIYANGAFAAMLETGLETIIGSALLSHVLTDDHGEMERVLELGGDDIDVRMTGTHRVVATAISVRRISGEEGDVRCVVAVDLTQRRHAEQELQAAHREAERANQAKDRFLSHISHELRTPLNAILGFNQLLGYTELDDEQRGHVGMVDTSARLLLDLVEDLLDVSQIETGREQLSLESVSVREAIGQAMAVLQTIAEDRRIVFWVESPDEDLHVLADRRRLGQILRNLLSNAVKFNIVGGTVRLTVRTTGQGSVALDVLDTGPGIAEDKLPLLFTPFERLGAETLSVPGTGLGLSLSRRLAEVMGGRLDYDATNPIGSRFVLELSQASAQPVTPSPARAAPKVAPPPVTATRGRVLYVEDSRTNALLVRKVLQRRPDIQLTVAETAAEGVHVAFAELPDLVLLDLHLPDDSGVTVLRALRDDPRTAHIPVVITSADATTRQIERLLAEGAQEYATKPIKVPWLLDLVDRELGRGSA